MAKDFNEVLKQGGNKAVQAEINEMLEGVDDEFAQAAIQAEKAKAEKEKEDAKKAAVAAEKEKAEIIKQILYLPHTDTDNAMRIALFCGDKVKYNIDTSKWGFYENNVWEFRTSNNSELYPSTRKIEEIIKKNIPEVPPKNITNPDGTISPNPNYTTKDAENEDKKNIIGKLHKKWSQAKTQRAAIELLKGISQVRIRQKDLDNYPYLINCGNCIVDLTTGKQYDHSPNYLMTQKARANYFPNLRSDTVDNFLKSIQPDEQTRAALLDFFGYAICGVPTQEKFLLMTGKGGNGKGTLTSLLAYLLDDYACAFPIEGILVSKYRDANSATPAFNVLENRRVAIADEIPPNAKIDTAVLKKLTGRDKIYIRQLHQEGRTLENPIHTMIFSGNNLPEVIDAKDVGIRRRTIHIKFEQDFSNNPDTTLKNRLYQQQEIDAFYSLLVNSAIEYNKRGRLLDSPAIIAATNEFFDDQDYIAEFIANNCTYREGGKIPRQEFINRLKAEYPEETSRASKNTLKDMLKKIDGVEYKHSNKGNVLLGIDWAE